MDELPAWATSPCCASEWPVTEASPPLPAPTGAFADGLYPLNVAVDGWSPYDPAVLRLRVARFERCGPDPGRGIWCETGRPDEMGVVRNEAVEVAVPLDGSLSVALTGWSCDEQATRWRSDGTGLTSLWAALDQDFDAAIRVAYLEGMSRDDVLAGLLDASGSLVADPCPEVSGYGVVWTGDSGPSVLFQGPIDDAGPLKSDALLSAVVLEVSDQHLTVYLQRTWMP